MWNCQKCNAEVDDGFEVCWSCGTTIDGHEDPSFAGSDAESLGSSAPVVATAEALETLVSPALPEHAHAIRCHLEGAGIAVFIADEPAQGFDWLLHPKTQPIHLQVRECDIERAKSILAEIPAEERASPVEQKGAELTEKLAAPAPPPPPAPSPVWEPANQTELDPQEYVRALESKLSALMDDHDTPDWKVNPAFHPEVTAFIQSHANNAAFLKKAQSMQQNRAKYFATMRQQAQAKADAPIAETPARTAEADAVSAEMADVPMCSEVTEESPKPSRPFRVPRFVIRLAKWTTILLLLAVVGVFLTATTSSQMGENEVKEAIAKIEETDRDWRWEDLQAKLSKTPEKNGRIDCQWTEQRLARGQMREEAVEQTQELLADEAARTQLSQMFREERALLHQWMNRAETEQSLDALSQEIFVGVPPDCPLSRLEHWLRLGSIKQYHAHCLNLLSEAVEAAKLPADERAARYEVLQRQADDLKASSPFVEAIFPPFLALREQVEFHCRSQTLLRCAIAALAAERYRLAHEKWPDSLEALVPDYLPKVPTDPYDGKPLRLSKREDGLLIHSVGPSPEPPGKEIGFRLWNLERRRQALKGTG